MHWFLFQNFHSGLKSVVSWINIFTNSWKDLKDKCQGHACIASLHKLLFSYKLIRQVTTNSKNIIEFGILALWKSRK